MRKAGREEGKKAKKVRKKDGWKEWSKAERKTETE
jgi:hypothetical protein